MPSARGLVAPPARADCLLYIYHPPPGAKKTAAGCSPLAAAGGVHRTRLLHKEPRGGCARGSGLL